MGATVVLDATAERRVSSSLTTPTKQFNGVVGRWKNQQTVNLSQRQ